MVDDEGDPPAERPALRQGKRHPGRPHAQRCGHDGQVHVMDMIWAFGCYDVVGLLGLIDGTSRRTGCLAPDHPLDGSGPQVKSRPREELRDLALTERRAQGLESLDDVPDEVRESVEWLSELDEGGISLLVDPLQPRGDGCRPDEEGLGGLGKRPSADGLEFKDGHAFGGRIVWPSARIELGHASVLDADLLAKEFDLLLEPVALGRKAYTGIDAVAGPATGARNGVVRQRDDVNDGGLDVLCPARRQRHVGEHLITHW